MGLPETRTREEKMRKVPHQEGEGATRHGKVSVVSGVWSRTTASVIRCENGGPCQGYTHTHSVENGRWGLMPDIYLLRKPTHHKSRPAISLA